MDSRCIQVVTPDDNVNIGFHEILLHDMGEEELPLVATSELNYLRRIWPRALFILCQDTSRIWNTCGRSASNGLAVHNLGTVHIVASISSGTWASTLPFTTRNSRNCGAVRFCGARCGRGLLRTVLITCGGFIRCRCQ